VLCKLEIGFLEDKGTSSSKAKMIKLPCSSVAITPLASYGSDNMESPLTSMTQIHCD
jgi:hypothetical protein